MRILLLGSTGMLGHILKMYLEERNYDVVCTTRDKEDNLYFDALDDLKRLSTIIDEVKPNVVVNCIGILNKAAEENKVAAVIINSYLPHFIDELSIEKKYKFIHISTDCVFEGDKGKYKEDSLKDATSFYGASKALGEINNDRNLTLRTSIIGPDENEKGIGLLKWFLSNPSTELSGFDKVIWSGVTTLELSKAIEKAFNSNLVGLFNIVNNKFINKYELLKLFKQHLKNNVIIEKNSTYISDKSLINTRTDYDFEIPSYNQMIIELKEWILKHKDYYNKTFKNMRLENDKAKN